MHCKTVAILLKIRVRGHFVMSITKNRESHYVTVLDNPRSLIRYLHGTLKCFSAVSLPVAKQPFHHRTRVQSMLSPSYLHNAVAVGRMLAANSVFVSRRIASRTWSFYLSGSLFDSHTAELAPSVRELTEMEFKAQTSFLSLQNRDWMKHWH